MHSISTNKPILIAGPTASGKSSLAIKLAKLHDGVVINADATQVYQNWQILSARPSQNDMEAVPHYLYGHLDMHATYSVGHWLRGIKTQLNICKTQNKKAIIVGGTGLYFNALTNGLAEIPAIPDHIRQSSMAILNDEGNDGFVTRLESIDPTVLNRIDIQNAMRTQRAWEVITTTGKSISTWQDETPDPILELEKTTRILLMPDKNVLDQHIQHRFEDMVNMGALEEVSTALKDGWQFGSSFPKAIGMRELADYINGKSTIETAKEKGVIATRQYAKRQRTWFKGRMKSWDHYLTADSFKTS